MPLLSTGDWGDIAVLRGPGSVVFPFSYNWLRICVVRLFLFSLYVEVPQGLQYHPNLQLIEEA
jgi:hypothetical protein